MSSKRKAKQARSKQTVDDILGGALQVLKRYGYGSFTTERVAERAGVSVGSIYQYFQNKDDILHQLLDREASKTLSAFKDIAEQDRDDKHEQLRDYLRIGVGEEYIGPKLFYELQRVPALQKKLTDVSFELMQVTSDMIMQLQPGQSSENAKRLAELIVSTSEGIAHPLHTEYDPALVDAYIDMVINFICKEN